MSFGDSVGYTDKKNELSRTRETWRDLSKFFDAYPRSGVFNSSSTTVESYNKMYMHAFLQDLSGRAASSLAGFLLPVTEDSIYLEDPDSDNSEFYKKLSEDTEFIIKSPDFALSTVIKQAIKDMLNYGNACVQILTAENKIHFKHLDIFELQPIFNLKTEELYKIAVGNMTYEKKNPDTYSEITEKDWTEIEIHGDKEGSGSSEKGRRSIYDPSIIYARYEKLPGNTWGIGQGIKCLRAIQAAELLTGEEINVGTLALNPPVALSKGLIEQDQKGLAELQCGRPVLTKGAAFLTDSIEGTQIANLFTGGDPGLSSLKLAELKLQIHNCYFGDFITVDEKIKTMTATQSILVNERYIQQMIPSIQSLQTELIDPVIRKIAYYLVFKDAILKENKYGAIPDSFTRTGYGVRYLNRFDLIKKEKNAETTKELLATIASVAEIYPEALSLLKGQKLLQQLIEASPIGASMLEKTDEVGFTESIKQNITDAQETMIKAAANAPK